MWISGSIVEYPDVRLFVRFVVFVFNGHQDSPFYCSCSLRSVCEETVRNWTGCFLVHPNFSVANRNRVTRSDVMVTAFCMMQPYSVRQFLSQHAVLRERREGSSAHECMVNR